MNKENCALKLVDEIILYYDAWSKKHQRVSVVIVNEIKWDNKVYILLGMEKKI